jgi:hypothetical protein
MVRSFVLGAAALFLFAGLALAADKNAVTGKIKKIDAEKSVITVTTGKKGMQEDKEFKINESTKFTVIDGDDKKEMSAKDGFKAPQLKEGASVALTLEGDKVTAVTVGKKGKK